MDIGWKIISLAGGVAAGFIAKQIVEKGWQLATGHGTPDEDSLEASMTEVVVFAAVTGTVNTLIRNLVMRQAQTVYNRAGRSVKVGVK